MIGVAYSCLLLLCVAGVYSHFARGPCHMALIKVKKPILIGQFVPQCRNDGYYKARQCHGSTGYCWCVSTVGQEVPYTKTGPGEELVNCTDGFPRGPCHTALLDLDPGLMMGQFVPLCTDDGYYEAQQCSGSTGYCWCVTKWGQEIPNTNTAPGEPLVNCTDGFPLGPCHEALTKVESGLIGAYVPQCRDDGYYEGKQCHGSTGYCWCVTKYGEEIPNTRVGPGPNNLTCIDDFPRGSCHERQLQSQRGHGFNDHAQFSCTDDGFYKGKMCYALSGYCWCVTRAGVAIPGTGKTPEQGGVVC